MAPKFLGYGVLLPPYSGFMFAAFITLAHFWASPTNSLSNSAGVPLSAVPPNSLSRALRTGSGPQHNAAQVPQRLAAMGLGLQFSKLKSSRGRLMDWVCAQVAKFQKRWAVVEEWEQPLSLFGCGAMLVAAGPTAPPPFRAPGGVNPLLGGFLT